MNDLSALWEPLDQSKSEIRVLLLKSHAVHDAPLEGRLENKSLNQALHFEAISYAWGGAQASIPLIMQTRDGSVEMPLTKHLGSALRALRRPRVTIALWIDAICISQRDRGEREQQIGMLHHIFHRAAEVHVWLGSQSEGRLDVRSKQSPQPQQPDQRLIDELMLAGHSMYWDRLWVVGEIVLARDLTLHYGQNSSSVRALMDQIEHSSFLSKWTLPRYLKDLFDLRTVLPSSMGRSLDEKVSLLLAVMNRARPRHVGDARDRVHAFIGLYNSLFNDEMRADYSADVATVYTAFAKRLINATGSLRILSQANSHYAVTPNLPSWVPDWASMYEHTREASDLSWWDAFSPGLAFRPVSFLDEGDEQCSLVVEAWLWDSVYDISGALESCTTVDPAKTTLAAWQQFYEDFPLDNLLDNWDTSPEQFARVLSRGVDSETASQDRFSIFTSLFPFSLAQRLPTVELAGIPQPLTFPVSNADLVDMRFFAAQAMVGIGPRHMRKDDVVAFLAGANVPFLLRKCAEVPVPSPVAEPQSSDNIAIGSDRRQNKLPKQLPPPAELAARIEEANTTARILTESVKSVSAFRLKNDEFVREFVERARLASESMMGYMLCQNPAPDVNTKDELGRADKLLQDAMSAYQKALKPTPPPREPAPSRTPPNPRSRLSTADGPRKSLLKTDLPTYYVVGTCYVDGVMHGELFKKPGRELRIRKIRLR